jgi:hypothetical protein
MPLPDAQAITRAIEVATAAPSAAYLSDGFDERIKAEKQENVPAFRDVSTLLKSNADNLAIVADTDGEYWAAKKPLLPSAALQQAYVEKASQALGQLKVNVIFNFAVSDESEFVRGYGPADAPVQLLDDMFNAWLAEKRWVNNVATDNEGRPHSFIYNRATEGAEASKVNPEGFRQAVMDEKTGFAAYVQQKSKALTLDARPNPFIAPAPKEEATPSTGGGAGGGGTA